MKHITILTISIFLFGQMALSQESLRFSLSEAQDYAIEHNKTLQNARLDVTLSERKYKETVAQGLPQVDGSVDWMTYFNYEMPFDFFGGESYSFTSAQIAEATQATKNQFSGILQAGINAVTDQDLYNYAAGSYNSNLLQQMLPPTSIKMNDVSTAKIQVGQLIFSGQYWTGIQVAKLGKKIAEQGLDNSILDIKQSVTNSYAMVLITEQTIETFKKSISNLNEIKGHTENMYKTGMAEQTDVDQLSIQVTMLENNLRSMERGLQMIYSMLKFQLGIDNNSNLELTENLEAIIAGINPKNKIIEFNINNNSMYQMLETQEKITQKMVDMQKMNYVPTITGFYARNQKIIKPEGFDMTPKNIAGVTMSVPIFSSGKRKEQVAQAKIELNKVQLNKSMVEDQLNIQNTQLQLDLKTAIENYDSQEENVTVAKRVYDNIQRKYEQGMASSLDLTQSNNNYIQAESNYIQATLALLQAKVAIDKLFNQL